MKPVISPARHLLAGIALGALLLSAPSQAQDLEQFSVMVPNTNTTNLYPLIVARDLGWFEKAGLNVNYLDSETTVPYVAFLSNGQADTAMLDAPQMFQGVNANQPIKAVFEGMQNAPEVLSVVIGGPIKTLEDLKGKTIGLASDRDQVTAQVVLDSAGISIDEVSTVVVSDQGPVVAKALQDGSVVAYAAGINDTTVLAAFGIEMQDLTPPELKVNPANTFAIWGPRTEEIRSRLEKFLRVWAMGIKAAVIDRDIVARMTRASVPEEWENEAAGEALLDASIKLNVSTTEKMGDLQPELWASVQGPYLKFGQIDAEIDPSTFLDDSFIDAANDFTDEEIKADLDAWAAANP